MTRNGPTARRAGCRAGCRAGNPSIAPPRSSVRPSILNRFRCLGLQKRIMLYVTAGLAVMFGVLAFLGLGAIEQATRLVYRNA